MLKETEQAMHWPMSLTSGPVVHPAQKPLFTLLVLRRWLPSEAGEQVGQQAQALPLPSGK